MQTANGYLKLDKYTEVPLKGCTPAEAQILRALHNTNAGGECLLGLSLGADVARSDSEEMDRLCQKFGTDKIKGSDKVKGFFPGLSVTFPKTFKEAGIQIGAPVVAKTEPTVASKTPEPEKK